MNNRSIFKEYKFICPKHGVIKSWQWNTTISIKCPEIVNSIFTCQEDSTRLDEYYSQNAQHFKPPIVAYNPKTKEYRPLASEKSRVPKGFERVELRTTNEIRKFTKYLDSEDIRTHDARIIREQIASQGYQDPLRDYKSQTELGAKFEEYAREKAKKSYTPRFDPGNMVEVFEYDRSNLERD